MTKIDRISIDTMTFDDELGEWKLPATFEAKGEQPHSHVVCFRASLAPDLTEDKVWEICTRAVLVAAGRYLLGTLTGEASATDFHHEDDLRNLTEQERSVLMETAA